MAITAALTLPPGRPTLGQAQVTLYVTPGGTADSGCTQPGADACGTIAAGLGVASSYVDSDVTVDVAAGTYSGPTDFTVPSGVSSVITLEGAGAGSTILDGDFSSPILSISTFGTSPSTVQIDDLTFTNGFTGGDSSFGAAAEVDASPVSFSGDVFSDNTAPYGAALLNEGGTVSLSGDTFSGNVSNEQGAAIFNSGTMTVDSSTFTGNSASWGGAIESGSSLSVTNSTFSDNSATIGGGDIYSSGSVTAVDDTFATGSGSGLENAGSSQFSVADSILDPAPCSGAIADGGYNVESDDSCGFGGTDVVNSSTIGLATTPESNNSTGPPTLAITSSSSAYEEVPTSACALATDERGAMRPGLPEENCDAGAFELEGGEPSGVAASPIAGGATVSWTAPLPGGAPLTGYTVTAQPGGASTSAGASATSASISGLSDGTFYNFSVTADYSGASPDTSFPSNTVVAGAPSAPTGVSVTEGNADALVTWTAPGSVGARPIAYYTVTAAPSGISCVSRTTSCTVGGLVNGTAYTFVVVATNAYGPGPGSSVSPSATPATRPLAPTGVLIVPSDGAVTVSWTPGSDNGALITGYEAQVGTTGPTCLATGPNPPDSCSITGLADGTPVRVRVQAENAAGASAWSAYSAAAVPSTVPGASTSITATVMGTNVKVSYAVPTEGGSRILSYTVTASPGGASITSTLTSVVFSGLSTSTNYTFTVAATNVNGSGTPSASSNLVTP